MTTSRKDDVPAAVQQQQLLKSLVSDLVSGSGQGWQRLEYRVKAMGRYREDGLTAVDPDGSRRLLDLSMQTARTVRSLRDVMAAPETGAWFTMLVRVDDSLQFDADFDYDGQPDWQTEPGISEYSAEQQKYPRSPENQPVWFRSRLADV